MEARKINEDSLVDLMLHLKWESEAANHTEVFQAIVTKITTSAS
jgi:hypothetical protein